MLTSLIRNTDLKHEYLKNHKYLIINIVNTMRQNIFKIQTQINALINACLNIYIFLIS